MRLHLLATAALVVGCSYDFDAYTPSGGGVDAAVDTAKDSATSPCSLPGAKSSGGHCYFPTSGALTWADAKKACSDAGGHLATVSGTPEESTLESMTAGADKWIGLSRPPGSPSTTNSFVWVTGEPMAYLKWGVGEPAGTGECARVKAAGAWADANCTIALVAICESE